MSKLSTGDALSKIIEQLQSLEDAERERVIRATLAFFGVAQDVGEREDDGNDRADVRPTRQRNSEPQVGAKAFFDKKQPQSKIEELAVAERFREETENAEGSSQEELRGVFGAARRTFDSHNFKRDLDNARTKGFFMRGTGRDSVQLSSNGQAFVDALPDRDKAKAIRPKVKRRGGGRKSPKKAKA